MRNINDSLRQKDEEAEPIADGMLTPIKKDSYINFNFEGEI